MFHVKHPWIESAADIGVTVVAEQVAQLDAYLRLLVERAVPMGMIAAGDLDRLPHRHILDSLRASPLIPLGSTVVDMGSGAGLPGVPLAIACPKSAVVLAEVRRRRVSFLELVVDMLPLRNGVVRPGTVDALEPESADIVVARAFADPTRAWRAAAPLLRDDGRFLYWAGRSFDQAALPAGVHSVVVPAPPQLAEGGPVVIMSAQ